MGYLTEHAWKSMLKDSLVDNCKDGKKDKCDFEHLNLCKNEKDCDYIGRYWYGNQCNENPEEDTSAGDTSVGEFDCPIPKGAKHIVTSYSWGGYDYWKINGNYVGPFQSWCDTEKTKKHKFICYNAEGKKHGVCWTWYEDGTLNFEHNYKDGKLHGVYRRWDEDGTLRVEYNYKDDKLHGVYRRWDEDGTPKYERNYKDDKLHGVYRAWDEDGTLRVEYNYKDGKLHGVYRRWDEDGTPNYEKNYKDDKLHGVYRAWYEDGTLRYEDNYKDGKEHGVSKTWSYNGKLIRECNYEEGKCVSCVHGDC